MEITQKFLGIGKNNCLASTKNAFQRHLYSMKYFQIPGTLESRDKASGEV